MSERAKKTVGILGWGRTGQAVAAFYDEHTKHVFDQSLSVDTTNPDLQFFPDDPTYLDASVQVIIVSPGIVQDHPILQAARDVKIPIMSELDLAFANLDCPIIAVTGSLGKSTMVKLIHDLLSKRFDHVFLGGNYGTPLIDACAQSFDIAVVEVSSFALAHSHSFSCDVGVFLTFYENHLDWHGDAQAYFHAKAKLFQNQSAHDIAILNADDPRIASLETRSQKILFSQKDAHADSYTDGQTWKVQGDQIAFVNPGLPKEQVLVLAFLARLYELSDDCLQKVCDQFAPLEHRLEQIAKADVLFVNDSKSTTPDATLFAVSMHADQPTHLIVCGQNKGMDVHAFCQSVSECTNIQNILIFGDVADDLERIIKHPNLVRVKDLPQAMEHLRTKVGPGETVLFSPGFASFDQYRNMAERGAHFKSLIWES